MRAGRFALRSVQSIDDVMECLTGAPAGAPEQLSDATVNGRIARRLRELARIRRGEPRALRRGATRTTPRAAGGSSGDNLG